MDATRADQTLRRNLRLAQIEAGHQDCDKYDDAPQFISGVGILCGCKAIIGPVEQSGQQEAAELATTVGVDEVAAAEQQEAALVRMGSDILREHVPGVIQAAIAAIDPTMPYGPREIEEQILDATTRLDRAIAYEAALIVAQFETEKDYKLARARAVWAAQGSNVQKQAAAADIAVEDAFREMVTAQQVCAAMKSVTHSLRSVLSGYQSLAKSVAAAYGATNRVANAAESKAF